MKNVNSLLLVTLILIAFLALVGIVWLFLIIKPWELSPTAGGLEKVIAAEVVLIGTLFTCIVSILGLVINHNVNQRSITRLDQETVLEAIKLLNFPDNSTIPLLQVSGALLALANLGQWNVVIPLMFVVKKNYDMDNGTIHWIIDKALTTSNESTIHKEVIGFMHDHPKTMITSEGQFLFTSVLWSSSKFGKLSPKNRMFLLQSIDNIKELLRTDCNKKDIESIATRLKQISNEEIARTEIKVFCDKMVVELTKMIER